MRVDHIPCGEYVNESERKAVERLKDFLKKKECTDKTWILLTNILLSLNHQLHSDELDIVLLSDAGVKVIEVKHWSPQWLGKALAGKEEKRILDREKEVLERKARKVGTTLRTHLPNLNYVPGQFLLTWEPSELKELKNLPDHFFTLKEEDLEKLLGVYEKASLTPQQVQNLAKNLKPETSLALSGKMSRFLGIVDLKLITPEKERFHRAYKGLRATQHDHVILNIYDLSASDDKDAKKEAQREFKALHNFQQYKWAPRILETFREAPGYYEELYYFTVADPAAPTLLERSKDAS